MLLDAGRSWARCCGVLSVVFLGAACAASSAAGAGGDSGDSSGDGSGGGGAIGGGGGASGSDGSGGSAGALPAADVRALSVIVNAGNVLSYFVDWQSTSPAPTLLDVDCGTASGYQHRFERSTPTARHSVFVMGLVGGSECTFTASAGGQPASATVTVGNPPAFLPALIVRQLDELAVEPGWTLVNLTNGVDQALPLAVALVDERGQYRWYHQRATTSSGSDTVAARHPKGVLIGGDRTRFGPTIVAWDGSIEWESALDMHHDIQPLGAPEQFVFLSWDAVGCPTAFGSDVLNHFDRATGNVLWQWRICQHYTPPVWEGDWSHINAVAPYPDGSAALLSSRSQHLIMKLDLESMELDWTLGEGGDFALSPADHFYRQHSPELQPNGNILLFDNGQPNRREWSRAIEIEIDEGARTARSVWEFRPSPDIFAPVWSDADRLGNGNTLVAFGRRGIGERSYLIEVTEDGREVWRLESPEKWGWYRAERITDPPLGEVR